MDKEEAGYKTLRIRRSYIVLSCVAWDGYVVKSIICWVAVVCFPFKPSKRCIFLAKSPESVEKGLLKQF